MTSLLRCALWAILMVVAALLPLPAMGAQGEGQGMQMLILHDGFFSAEKYRRLQSIAAQEGITLRHLDVERGDAGSVELTDAPPALTVLDTPRPNDRAVVEAFFKRLPGHERLAVLAVGGGRPSLSHFDPQYTEVLASLYEAGGEAGFRRFFALAKAVHEGRQPSAELLAPPAPLPPVGFYHPQAPQVFPSLQSYLGWYASRPDAPATTGRAAFLTYSGMVSDLLNDQLDTLIARTEAAGILPIVFWFDASTPDGLPSVLGKDQIDVLINLSHLQHGEARKRDFLALDVPVIQTLRYRDGTTADWPRATSGISARVTALFLALPENWGMSDPIILSAKTPEGFDALLPEQMGALTSKLKRLIVLRHRPAGDKKLGIMFWNYPAGEKNLGASNMNIPRSLLSLQAALAAQGYDVGAPLTEMQAIDAGQRMLSALYGNVTYEDLLAENLADLYPLADYRQWLETLPAGRRKELLKQGDPGKSRAVREIDGQRYFVIPRWQLGKLLVMPQIPRHAHNHHHYHDVHSVPDHHYLAAYLYLRQRAHIDALIHFGTHGTQEWLPGKDRGMAVSDYPWLAVGDLPVFYPYIQDNIGEAIQAKRRGRAVTISHQTPPFAPAGLYDQLRDLHHLIHEYQQLDPGATRQGVAQKIRAVAFAANLHKDLGWSEERAEQQFDGFLQALHDHLHELARTASPLGLHTFGQPASENYRIVTILQQLGEPFYATLGVEQNELFAEDFSALQRNPAYRAVQRMIAPPQRGTSAEEPPLPDAVAAFADRARELNRQLTDTQENESLLAGLAGKLIPPGSGGDPIRNPGVASGRNLYAFEADKLPTRAAYESAATAYRQLIEAYRQEHDGQWPQKIAFSLWSSEAIRHLGVTESQILHALGLRPVWDKGGRVTALDIIPAAELGHPRSDVVIQVTGVYRDQFDHFMRLLDDAITRLAALDEPDNPIAANNRRIAQALQSQGFTAQEADALARTRIFGNAPGRYGTGVPDLALASTQWQNDSELAKQFLASNRYAYGKGHWGQNPSSQVNPLAEQLRGTQMAVLSRSTNVHGVLSTDHPFEFLGGLSSAVRYLDGKAPQLVVSDLRGNTIKTTALSRFLADELRVRYLNPQWIQAMQAEGYAGALEALNVTNNFFGWQAMDPSTVRSDQWQALFDTYVTDTRKLGTREWFEQHHPTAQAQIIERMAEAIRKGYWDASQETRQALVERWQELHQRFQIPNSPAVTRQFIEELAQPPAQGAGLHTGAAPQTPATAQAQAQASAPNEAPLQTVQGQELQPVAAPDASDTHTYWVLALMLLLLAAGALHQQFTQRPRNSIQP